MYAFAQNPCTYIVATTHHHAWTQNASSLPQINFIFETCDARLSKKLRSLAQSEPRDSKRRAHAALVQVVARHTVQQLSAIGAAGSGAKVVTAAKGLGSQLMAGTRRKRFGF